MSRMSYPAGLVVRFVMYTMRAPDMHIANGLSDTVISANVPPLVVGRRTMRCVVPSASVMPRNR